MSKAPTAQTDPFADVELHAADVITGTPEGEGFAAEVQKEGDPDAAAAVATPTPAAGVPGAPAAQAPAPEFEPPVQWPQAAKDAWKALHGAPDARNHLQQVHGVLGQTQAYVTNIERQNAEYRRNFEPIAQVLAPAAQEWARQGMDVQTGVRQLMAWNEALTKDPQGALLQLAETLGVDLAQVTSEQPYVDPMVAQVQQQLQQSRAEFQQFRLQAEQQQQQLQQQQLLSQVQAFQNEKDAQGNPKHPHFETVINDMLTLYTMGRASSPEDAYALAVQLNPALQAEAAKAAAAEVVKRTQASNAQVAQTVAKSGKPHTRPDRGSSGDSESLDSLIKGVIAESQT
jgi:hypothetical protein